MNSFTKVKGGWEKKKEDRLRVTDETMRVSYSFMDRNSPLFLPSMMVLEKSLLNAKSKLGKSFKLCLEYNKDLKTEISRDSVPEGMERVTVPRGREWGVSAHHDPISFLRILQEPLVRLL